MTIAWHFDFSTMRRLESNEIEACEQNQDAHLGVLFCFDC